MRIEKELDAVLTTQEAFAKAVGIEAKDIPKLAKEGAITLARRSSGAKERPVKLLVSIKSFFARHVRPLEGKDGPNYYVERARHERAKRRLAERRLERIEESLFESKMVETFMGEHDKYLRAELRKLPGLIASMIAGKSKEEIYVIMTREVENKLFEVSENPPDGLKDDMVAAAEQGTRSRDEHGGRGNET